MNAQANTTVSDEPIHHTFARIAHKAALRIRPDVSGDQEYWRLREAITQELVEGYLPISARRATADVTEAAAKIERQATIIRQQASRLRRLRAEIRRTVQNYVFRSDPLNRAPGLYLRIYAAKRERVLSLAALQQSPE